MIVIQELSSAVKLRTGLFAATDHFSGIAMAFSFLVRNALIPGKLQREQDRNDKGRNRHRQGRRFASK